MQKRSFVSHSVFLHTPGAGGGEALGTRLDNANRRWSSYDRVIVEASGGAMDLALCFVLLVALGVTRAEYPFRNTSLPFDARVKASISVHASSLPQRNDTERLPPRPILLPYLEQWLFNKALTFLLYQL